MLVKNLEFDLDAFEGLARRPPVIRALVLICAALHVIVAASSANASRRLQPNSRLSGTWIPIASDRSRLKRIVISGSGKSCMIHAWAYATFTQIDWGKTTLTMFAPDVDSKSFDYGLAVWKQGFAIDYMTLHVVNNHLVVEDLVNFTDGSNRSNYRSVEYFRRLK